MASGGVIRLDYEPTAAEAGLVYRYLYEASLVLSAATDELPVSEEVYRALVPVVVEWYERSLKGDFDVLAYSIALDRAVAGARAIPLNRRWGVK